MEGACALPFFAAALFARALGWLGRAAAPPPGMPVPAGALPLDGGAVRALLAVVLVLALGWLAWPVLVVRLGVEVRPDAAAGGLAMLAVVLGVGVVVWVRNPYAALLVLPALHLWLLILSPALRPRRGAALVLVGLALVPLALLIAFYARELAWVRPRSRGTRYCCSRADTSGSWRRRCGAWPLAARLRPRCSRLTPPLARDRPRMADGALDAHSWPAVLRWSWIARWNRAGPATIDGQER